MSTIGIGPEDWPEFDLDGIERDAHERVHQLVERHRSVLERELGGPFGLEPAAHGKVYLRRDGVRHLIAQVTASGRLLITPLHPGTDRL
ncbi:MAG: hypothetical protein S0880_08235 [Actinomycetota bacterium]|nr:hypothetical protein [Actinomycetota bacterium]